MASRVPVGAMCSESAAAVAAAKLSKVNTSAVTAVLKEAGKQAKNNSRRGGGGGGGRGEEKDLLPVQLVLVVPVAGLVQRARRSSHRGLEPLARLGVANNVVGQDAAVAPATDGQPLWVRPAGVDSVVDGSQHVVQGWAALRVQ